jgi:hypothetical protein
MQLGFRAALPTPLNPIDIPNIVVRTRARNLVVCSTLSQSVFICVHVRIKPALKQ